MYHAWSIPATKHAITRLRERESESEQPTNKSSYRTTHARLCAFQNPLLPLREVSASSASPVPFSVSRARARSLVREKVSTFLSFDKLFRLFYPRFRSVLYFCFYFICFRDLMMIGENPESGYQCKLSNKIFSSGPVLGGHMRSHEDKNLLEKEPPLVIDNSSEEGRRLGYCLRENPKKSWKFLELKEDAPENPCLVCDKRFRSMKALFSHMKIHPRKDGESGDPCEDRGKGSGSRKSCQDHTRPIQGRKRLNSSLLNEDHLVGSSKTKSGLLLIVLSDDEAMRMTRRKRTPRVAIDVDERAKGVLFSVPNGSSDGSEEEQDLGRVAAVTLIMMSRRETDFNSLGLGVEPSGKSSAPGSYDVGKGKITEAFEGNEIHSRGYSRMKQKGAELEVPASMLCGSREVKDKKPEAARSGKEPMYEATMMDCYTMGTAGSRSRERAELWIKPGINSYRGKVCAEECQIFGESGEKNKYEGREAESCKQEDPVDASQGIEGSQGRAELDSIKDGSEKGSRQGMNA